MNKEQHIAIESTDDYVDYKIGFKPKNGHPMYRIVTVDQKTATIKPYTDKIYNSVLETMVYIQENSLSEVNYDTLKNESLNAKSAYVKSNETAKDSIAEEKIKMLQFFVKNDITVHGEVQPNTLEAIEKQNCRLVDGQIVSSRIVLSSETKMDELLKELKNVALRNSYYLQEDNTYSYRNSVKKRLSAGLIDLIKKAEQQGILNEFINAAPSVFNQESFEGISASISDLNAALRKSGLELNDQVHTVAKTNSTEVEIQKTEEASDKIKQALVVNVFGGPQSNKGNVSIQIVEALKRKGIKCEYVPKYVEDLEYSGNITLLDGTEEHQRTILAEQKQRIDQLIGNNDIIVTDNPLLLNLVYANDHTEDFESVVSQQYNEYKNFAFFLDRSAGNNSIEVTEKLKHIDLKVCEVLDKNNIRYGRYSQENMGKVIFNISKVFYGMTHDQNVDQKKESIPEEKAENKKGLQKTKEKFIADQKTKLAQVNNKITDIAMNYVDRPEDIAELLEFGTKFYAYSVKNTMLIMSQNRGASYVQSFENWKKDGYCVKKGEKGIKVLVPVKTTYLIDPDTQEHVKLSNASATIKKLFKSGQVESYKKTYFTLGNVFDIAQTNCPVENYPKFYSMGFKDVNQDKIIEGIKNFSKNQLTIPVLEDDLKSITLRGYYSPGRKVISLNKLLKTSEKLSTLSHELGHAVMEHSAFDNVKNAYQREFEADCFSIMIDEHLGVPITETRKRHLSLNFKKMENDYLERDVDYEFDKIIGDVFKRYNQIIKDMDQSIQKELENEMEQVQVEQDKKEEEAAATFDDDFDINIIKKPSATLTKMMNKENQVENENTLEIE